jgi:hypothetical protein
MADCVEKVLFRLGLKILRAAGASLSLRGEGPHQLPQKRSLALVSILQRLAAAGANRAHVAFWQILLQNRHTDGAGRPVHFF